MNKIQDRYTFSSLKVLLVLLMSLFCLEVYGEEEWESIPLNDSWNVDSELNCTSNSASSLSIINIHSKKSDIFIGKTNDYLGATYYIPSDVEDNYIINLDVTNKHSNFAEKKYKVLKSNGKEDWVKDGNEWMIVIGYQSRSGGSNMFKIQYHDYVGRGYPKSNACSFSIYNGSSWSAWAKTSANRTREIMLAYNSKKGLKISGYNGSDESILNDVARVKYIIIYAGSSANINCSLEMSHQTLYGVVKPGLDEAMEQYNNGDLWGAINTYTNIIDNYGFKQAYYARGYVYKEMEYYKTAIEDFDKALMQNITQNQREMIYFERGVCKFMLDDVAGAISDFKLGGSKGQAIIKELDLENSSVKKAQQYKPTNTPQTKSKPNNNQNTSKPSLKK